MDRLTRAAVRQQVRVAMKASGQIGRDDAVRDQEIEKGPRMAWKLARVLAAQAHVQEAALSETPAVAFEVPAEVQPRLFGIEARARQLPLSQLDFHFER